MPIYQRGKWPYRLTISPLEDKFLWHVFRLKFDSTRIIPAEVGTRVADGIAASREEAEREGVAAIDHHSKHSA